MKEHPEDPKCNNPVPGFTYAWMIPYLTKIGRRHGYAMAIHGSMSRDLDVIAVPWVQDANEPEDLLKDLLSMVDGRLIGNPEKKPFGRTAYTIVFPHGWHFIDLSIMQKRDEAVNQQNIALRAENLIMHQRVNEFTQDRAFLKS